MSDECFACSSSVIMMFSTHTILIASSMLVRIPASMHTCFVSMHNIHTLESMHTTYIQLYEYSTNS